MATITALMSYSPTKSGGYLMTVYGTSAANTSGELTSPVVGRAHRQRVVSIHVHYSAAPTQTGVTVTKDSARGSAYDSNLSTGVANSQDFVYIPDEGELWIGIGDAILVTAPAAGGVITSSIEIVLEQEG